VLGIRPRWEIGSALSDQFKRQIRAKPMNLGDVAAKQSVSKSFACFLVARTGGNLPTGTDAAFRNRCRTAWMRKSQSATLA